MKEIIKKIGDLSIPLIVGIAAALVWANIDASSYNRIIYAPLAFGVNFSFFGQRCFWFCFSVRSASRSCTELLRAEIFIRSKTPSATCSGHWAGFCFRLSFFFALNHFFGSPAYNNGWAIPTATDVAISLLFAQIIFGRKHPAFTFLLLLAIADDVAGLAIIALFYPDPELPVELPWLSLVFVAVAVAWLLNKHRVRSYWFYLLAGVLSWIGLHEANMHPSLALIFIIPFIPHTPKPGQERCPTELDRFEADFKTDCRLRAFFSSDSAMPVSFFPVFPS